MRSHASLNKPERARFYLAWAIVLLGVIHALATPYFFSGFTEASLWFASGGGAFILVGAFNLLAVSHGIPALVQISRVANVATTAFIIALILAPPTGPPEFIAALLIIPATVLSFTSPRSRAVGRVAA